MVGKEEGLLDATVGTGARVVGFGVGAGEMAEQTVPDPVKPFHAGQEKCQNNEHNDKHHNRRFVPTHLHCICK